MLLTCPPNAYNHGLNLILGSLWTIRVNKTINESQFFYGSVSPWLVRVLSMGTNNVDMEKTMPRHTRATLIWMFILRTPYLSPVHTHPIVETWRFRRANASARTYNSITVLTLYAPMDSSFWFETVSLGLSIVYIEESQVIIISK